MKTFLVLSCLSAVGLMFAVGPAKTASAPDSTPSWNPKAASEYLDKRETWWLGWSKSQRDHGTACVSCHTAVPYALGRPALRGALGESAPSATESQMLAYVVKRVKLWNEVEPFYSDEKVGPQKTPQSRGTEAVLNALILANYDSRSGKWNDVTRSAFDAMWAIQLKSGENAGAWNWLNFHNSPWEADESQYWGATLAAVAVGMAPAEVRKSPTTQENVDLLASYLKQRFASQPLVNRIVVLWASAKVPGLLTPEQRGSLADAIFTQQKADGGWSLAQLDAVKRHDGTPLEDKSDGYATGLTVLALVENGYSPSQTNVKRALGWLAANQSKTEGLWPAYSLNKQRDLSTDVGHFMSDAATGYAVMALEKATGK